MRFAHTLTPSRGSQWLQRMIGALLIACTAAAPGCKSGPRAPIDRGPAPTFAEAAGRYNEGVRSRDHLWTPVALRLKYRDAESGRMTEDLLDGHLQAIAPDRVALRIDKLSETYAYLGCDQARYWWIDVKSATAIVGLHALATPESLARFDVPVHPLDLVELLAVVAIDPAGYGATRWSTDGRTLGILTRSRTGNRMVWVDPESYEPSSVELTDGEGKLMLSSTLTRPERIPIDGEPGSKARIATNYELDLVGEELTLVVRMQGPENRRERIRPGAFDMDAVMRTYRVKDIIDADAPDGASPKGDAGSGGGASGVGQH